MADLWIQEKVTKFLHNRTFIKTIYTNSIENKIYEINKLNPDIFIDDLSEVVNHPFLDKKIQTIQFSESGANSEDLLATWSAITRSVFKVEL